MVSVTSSSTASPDLVGGLTPVSQASLLKSLQDVAVLAQRFLGYQPDAAQVSKNVFRQALEQQFKGALTWTLTRYSSTQTLPGHQCGL